MTEAELLSQIKPGMMIGILGEPGSGKTALGLRVAELLKKKYGLGISMYGVPSENRDFYPQYIHFLDSVEDPSQIPTNSVLLYEELSLTAHSRRSMSQENVVLCQLKNIRRHRNVTLICICQRGSEMDKNLANSIQLLLIKRPEPFQHLPGSDRPQFQHHLKKAAELYKDPKIKNAKHWVYVSSLEKLVQTKLPSFWNNQISLSLGSPGPVGMKSKAGFTEPKPAHQMSRDEKIVEALILRMEGKSFREIGRDHLAVHHSTAMCYVNNYRNHPRSRLPEEKFEALRVEAKAEYARRRGKQAPPEPEVPEEEGWHPEPEPEVAPKETSVTDDTQDYPGKALEDFKERVDARRKEEFVEKAKVPIAIGAGVGAGAASYVGIGVIDNAIDNANWSEERKSWAKWGVRITDLALGVVGTIANVFPIVKGEAEWWHPSILGAAAAQIPVSAFKMNQLHQESVSPREEPVQDWRETPMVQELLSQGETSEEVKEEVEQQEQDTEQLVTADILKELNEQDVFRIKVEREEPPIIVEKEIRVPEPELTLEDVYEFYDRFLAMENQFSDKQFPDEQKVSCLRLMRDMLKALEAREQMAVASAE